MSAYDCNNFYIYCGSDFWVGKVSRAAGPAFVFLFIFSLVSAMMVYFVSCWDVSIELSDFVWRTMADGREAHSFLFEIVLVSSHLEEMCMPVTASSDTAEIAVSAQNGSHYNSLEAFFFFFFKHLYFKDFRNYSIPSPESSWGGGVETSFFYFLPH